MPRFAPTRPLLAAPIVWTAFILALGFSTPAAAQVTPGETAPADLAIAVSFNSPADVNRQPECIEFNLPCHESGRTAPDAGWAILASRNFTNRFALTGEAGLFHDVWDSAASEKAHRHEDNLVHFAMIGPRLATEYHEQRGRTPSEVRAFGQLLVGVAGGDVVVGGLAVQPGGGGDIRFSNGVIVRLQLDYTFVPSSGRSISGARILLGVGIGVGSRVW